MIWIIAAVLCSYAIGGFPTAWVFASARGIDLHQIGSGNVGATNASRALGVRLGALIALIDILKGVFPTAAVLLLFDGRSSALICAYALIIGHIYTPYIPSSRGGKGVATAAGVISILYPILILPALVLFIIIVVSTRFVSLASILTFAMLPFGLLAANRWFTISFSKFDLLFLILVGLSMLFTHRANIQRLLHGKERRFGTDTDNKRT